MFTLFMPYLFAFTFWCKIITIKIARNNTTVVSHSLMHLISLPRNIFVVQIFRATPNSYAHIISISRDLQTQNVWVDEICVIHTVVPNLNWLSLHWQWRIESTRPSHFEWHKLLYPNQMSRVTTQIKGINKSNRFISYVVSVHWICSDTWWLLFFIVHYHLLSTVTCQLNLIIYAHNSRVSGFRVMPIISFGQSPQRIKVIAIQI